MAPIDRTPHTMSTNTIPPVRAKTSSEYTTIVVGHGSSAVMIQTLIAPSIHALIPDKAMAFDFLFDQLKAFHPAVNVIDLTTALSNHFDVNHSVARSETAAVISTLNSALFHCVNLSGIRFLNRDGAPVNNVSEDHTTREDGIAFFTFDSTVTPSKIDCRLSDISPFTIRFALPLPQHDHAAINQLTCTTPTQTTNTPPTFVTMEEALEKVATASLPVDGEDPIDTAAHLAALHLEIQEVIQKTPTARRLFHSTTAPGTFTSLSPKMARLLASSGNPGTHPTYLGSLNFLDDQETFDSVFPLPTPLEENGNPSDHKVAASVANRLADFLGSCKLSLFAHVLRTNYVGSNTVSNPETIRQISDRLSWLSIVYQARGQTHTCRVDDLFKKYLSEVPILPNDTRLWGFTLPNYFWSALPEEMQCRITANKLYTQPDMSTLVTKTSQLNELRKLREAAVQAAKEIANHDTKLNKLIAENMK